MNQQGDIVEIVDSVTAKLKLKRYSACVSCGKCATTSESKDIIVEVDNTIGAKVGDRVERGEVIATVAEANGNEYKDGAHLHFEMLVDGENVDPSTYLTLEEK